jgi:hypothetical protein
MPDVTMCYGEGCAQKESCYRYLATPDKYWQSYFTTPPVDENGNCDYYWKHDDKNNDIRRIGRETS